MGSYVKLDGLEKLKKVFLEKAKLAPAKVILRQNGAEMQQKAMRNAPVDTGTLKRSIALHIIDDGCTAEVEASAEYAGYVEYGTRFMAAQPYLRPALAEQKVRLEADLKKIL